MPNGNFDPRSIEVRGSTLKTQSHVSVAGIELSATGVRSGGLTYTVIGVVGVTRGAGEGHGLDGEIVIGAPVSGFGNVMMAGALGPSATSTFGDESVSWTTVIVPV